jgi:hypothetical protein
MKKFIATIFIALMVMTLLLSQLKQSTEGKGLGQDISLLNLIEGMAESTMTITITILTDTAAFITTTIITG